MITAHPTAFADLNVVVAKLVAANEALLADSFVGAYLHGSFAVGDADEASDVDSMIVVKHEIVEDQVVDSEAIQARTYQLDSNWAKHLEGSYITRGALRRYRPESAALLYFDNGSVVAERSHHDNNLVVRWQLRGRGITLAGPAIRDLIDPIPVEDLRQEVLAVMRSRGDGWLAQPENINNRFYQPFAVLTYCRMLHTVATGTVVSKPAAAAWAQQRLDRRWADLIQRAVDDRPEPSLRARTPADPDEVAQWQTSSEATNGQESPAPLASGDESMVPRAPARAGGRTPQTTERGRTARRDLCGGGAVTRRPTAMALPVCRVLFSSRAPQSLMP